MFQFALYLYGLAWEVWRAAVTWWGLLWVSVCILLGLAPMAQRHVSAWPYVGPVMSAFMKKFPKLFYGTSIILIFLFYAYTNYLYVNRMREEFQANAPIIEGLRFVQRKVSSSDSSLPYALEVVIQTDKTSEPTNLMILCSGSVERVAGPNMSIPGIMFNAYAGVVVGRSNSVRINFDKPPFQPKNPISVTLFSLHAIQVEKITRMQSHPRFSGRNNPRKD